MFTGLVEGTGTVVRLAAREAGRRLEIALGAIADGVRAGDSIAVSGACLTVVALAGDVAAFDVVPETLRRTSLGRLERGARVNLERALKLGDRLGGHLVQGHVDGTARVVSLARGGAETLLTLAIDRALRRGLIAKGSVAIDGVSLTVASLEPERFAVALIPHTLGLTSLADRAPGDLVNIELDLVGKWVSQMVAPYVERGLSEGFLRDHGF